MKVAEITLREPITFLEKDTLNHAVEVFSVYDIARAPVVDEKGIFKGIISQKRIFQVLKNGGDKNRLVSDFIDKDVQCIFSDDSIEDLFDRSEEEFPVVDKKYRLIGIITKTDILKKSLERLKYIANSLNALLESTSNATITIDREGKFIFCNNAAGKLLDLDPKEVIGKPISELIPESTLPEVIETGERQVNMPITIKNKHFVSSRSPIIQDGKIVGAVAVFQDMTEYEKLIDELASEKHLRETLNTILEIAYDGIVVTDPEGYITMISDTYKRFLGVADQDVIGKHVTEVIENTRMHIVGKTGIPEIARIQKIRGNYMIASRLPIIKDGKVVGVVGKVLFRDVSELNALIKRVTKMEKEIEYYKGELQKVSRAKYSFEGIVGISNAIAGAKKMAKTAATSDSNVLILGESGTGKELFAHAIHQASRRANAPFIRINCAAIPSELLEAELFGYEEGAFTGAKKGGKIGKFELADGGTIFLDEIGDMPLHMQAKLLRVLQEREIERVGGIRYKKVDVRIIAATNHDLEQLISEGKMREDLYYRLNVLAINIPPLRERKEDIKFLVYHFIDKLSNQMGKQVKKISNSAMCYLESYSWPGNVRELINVLERAINFVDFNGVIQPEHLPKKITGYCVEKNVQTLHEVVAKVEKDAILNALKYVKGNRTRACKILGVSRSTLYEKMARYGIDI